LARAVRFKTFHISVMHSARIKTGTMRGVVWLASFVLASACQEGDDVCVSKHVAADRHRPEVVSLLQFRSVGSAERQNAKKTTVFESDSCTPLKNQGAYFSVELCVGTPPQCFDVVADTGSDSVIVPSCICDDMPGTGCDEAAKCFRGTNASSTFSVSEDPPIVAITFGSGTIEAAIATDVVKVGNISQRLEDGVLLMTNRAQLQIDGSFEGILGLGIPKDAQAVEFLQQTQSPNVPLIRDMLCMLMPEFCDDPNAFPAPGRREPKEPFRGRRATTQTKLYLEEANIDRFTMCFRDNNQSGALHLDVPAFSSPIANIGTFHWGLDFRGLSIGPQGEEAPMETIFCGPETMTNGMDSPCGIIPDSGTTQITGPPEQVALMEATICEKWPRCKELGNPSSDLLRKLLYNCSDWLTEDQGLHEIPSTFWHLKTHLGGVTAFELTAWAWVTEMSLEAGVEGGSNRTKVCTSNFGVVEYNTKSNGQVWILGTPLFYEYDVGYDLKSKMMSLTQGHCEPCADETAPAMLLADGSKGSRYKWPRRQQGKPRRKHINVNLPL